MKEIEPRKTLKRKDFREIQTRFLEKVDGRIFESLLPKQRIIAHAYWGNKKIPDEEIGKLLGIKHMDYARRRIMRSLRDRSSEKLKKRFSEEILIANEKK